jgi:arylsulfatase A-like enzyme
VNRREFLRFASTTAAALALPGSAGATGSGIIRKPNVLFISIDDLNDWIEPLGGHPQARTPNLRRFAQESVNFTHAYCPSPSCCPSRTAIMTGQAPYTSGVYSNYQDWREVIKDYTSLGNCFRQNGYYSAGAGKIYHYHMVDPSCWDEYWPSQTENMPDEYLPQKHAANYDPEKDLYKTINMPAFENMYKMFDWTSLDIDDSLMGDYQSVEEVARQLRRDHDKPFFLACGIYRPHVPWYVPQKYYDMFPLESVKLPKVLESDLDDVGDRVRDIALRGGQKITGQPTEVGPVI